MFEVDPKTRNLVLNAVIQRYQESYLLGQLVNTIQLAQFSDIRYWLRESSAPRLTDGKEQAMKQTRRKDSPAFKAEVVLAALETHGVDARLTVLA